MKKWISFIFFVAVAYFCGIYIPRVADNAGNQDNNKRTEAEYATIETIEGLDEPVSLSTDNNDEPSESLMAMWSKASEEYRSESYEHQFTYPIIIDLDDSASYGDGEHVDDESYDIDSDPEAGKASKSLKKDMIDFLARGHGDIGECTRAVYMLTDNLDTVIGEIDANGKTYYLKMHYYPVLYGLPYKIDSEITYEEEQALLYPQGN